MKLVVLDGYTLNPGDLNWEGIKKFGDLEVHDRTPESQIVLYSDGLIEATNSQGTQFGIQGLVSAVDGTLPGHRFKSIDAALTRHLEKSVATDDVSLMVINCP